MMRITGGLTKRLLFWSDEHNGKSRFLLYGKLDTNINGDLILGLQERLMQQTDVQYNFVSIMSYLFSRLLDIELVYYSKFCFYPVSE
jgi:hypothetical protein